MWKRKAGQVDDLQTALAHHQAGRLDDAERMSCRPDTAEAGRRTAAARRPRPAMTTTEQCGGSALSFCSATAAKAQDRR
jgi:hypothetical protein